MGGASPFWEVLPWAGGAGGPGLYESARWASHEEQATSRAPLCPPRSVLCLGACRSLSLHGELWQECVRPNLGPQLAFAVLSHQQNANQDNHAIILSPLTL